MGHLPAFRFKTYCAPFSSVALDFFGPLKIKKTRNVVINGSCLVIVCNTTRVIHLEITETQSTNDFLLAWRRFINKRGVHPSHAYIDRGQTFVGAQKPLRDWISNWNESIVRDTMASLSTTFEFSWDFNIPLASHMNGVVESLIRSCRKAFDCATDYHKRSYSYPEWESWLRNMPPSLMLRSKWFRSRRNLRVGDYVIVLEPGMKGKTSPRGLWEHAIVEKTLPGRDELVRKVELRLSGQRNLTRPIHKLCLIATVEELNST